MRTYNTKTRIGMIAAAGTGAAALAVAGFALPASADDNVTSTDASTTATQFVDASDPFYTWVSDLIDSGDFTASPQTAVGDIANVGPLVQGPLVSDSLNGDVASGNQTPVVSGNDTTAPIGSGNDTTAPIGSGNDLGSGNEVGSGNDVTAPVDAPVGSGNDTGVSTGDAGVSTGDNGASVGDISGSVEDISGSVDDVVGGVTSGVDDVVDGALDLGGILR